MRWFYLALVFLSTTLLADPTCKKCELIRKYNTEHPGDYEFYEDYLKAHEDGKISQVPADRKQ